MEGVARKDARAFSELYDRYSDRMVNYFYGMLWRDREKAEDFMQDLFAKLVHKPESYQPGRPFKTWFFSVANNMCKNEYRRMEVRKNTVPMPEHDLAGETGGEVSNALDRGTFHAMLDDALEGLDEAKRSTFIMRYREEMSIKEISEALACSEGTVKSRLFYTLKGLHEKLKAFEDVRFND